MKHLCCSQFNKAKISMSNIGLKPVQNGECDSIKISYGQYVVTGILSIAYNIGFGAYIGYKGFIISNNWGSTLSHPWLIVVYVCEILFYFSGLLSMIETLVPPSRRPDSLLTDQGPFPNVDVFVTCCKEDIEVIRDTLRSVLATNYPENKLTIYVLDDGKDTKLKELCALMQMDLGVANLVYVSRDKPKGVPHHFKAGNINYGLSLSTSEFVTILDADMIVHPDFLKRMIPHIVNSKNTAFVQTPQCFYNIRDGDPLSDSQPMWFYNVLLHRDTIDFASCCGTGVMFRRTALQSIGGFKTESITEDALTSMMLMAKGYKTVYLNYKLQMGLAPWTFRGYLAQRDRWSRGSLQMGWQVFRHVVISPSSALGLYKRLNCLWYVVGNLMYVINLILVCTFIAILAFNWVPYPGSEDDGRRLLFFLAPVIVVWRMYWIMSWIHVPHAFQQRNREEQAYWWMTPYMVETIWGYVWNTLFGRCCGGFKFISTGSIDGERSMWDFATDIWNVKWHLLYIGGTGTLIGLRIYNLDFTSCKDVIFVFGISCFLALIMVYMTIPVMCAFISNSLRAKDRSSLLVYDSEGVPIFDTKRTVPALALHTIIYEIMTLLFTAIWIAYFFVVLFNYDTNVCNNIRQYCTDNNC
jgi:cellulose synthase/poly-beta-1,6-N-acetylglucosamine synthase-like glycosyltransferase